jgi:hypothetical protein
VLLNNDLD